MTVTIDLAPDVEAEVSAQAEAEGIAVEDYLPRLIQRALPHGQSPRPLRQGSREWLALLHQAPPVARIDPATGQAPPMITRDDLRREHLYEDRA